MTHCNHIDGTASKIGCVVILGDLNSMYIHWSVFKHKCYIQQVVFHTGHNMARLN